jgi:hypothetical protein
MEVHQHSHTPRQKWTHYFWEFFMLFLAVTAGFFVENIREHFVETKREKQFIKSMSSDVKDDISELDSILLKRRTKLIMMDSLLYILGSENPEFYGNQLYYFARWLPRTIKVVNNDGTMTQLKNAGNLRLIRNEAALSIMLEYDQQARFGIALEEREESMILQTYAYLKTLFDAKIFDRMVTGMIIARPEGNPKLLLKDKAHIAEFYSQVHFLKNVNTYQIEFGEKRLNLAKKVLNVLRNEYHLH